MQEAQVWFLGQETQEKGLPSWRREWQCTLVFLPGKSHRQRSLMGYSPRGRKESDTTEWPTLWLSKSRGKVLKDIHWKIKLQNSMSIWSQFCEYKTYICINEVIELSNAFGVLVIHLAGKEVYVIYIYIYVFFFYLPSSLYFLSEEVYLFKAILKANDQQDRGLFSHLVVIQCKLRSLSWSVGPLHLTHPLLTLLFFSVNPCLAPISVLAH